MLIRTQEEFDQLDSPKHRNCTLCARELHFPRIVVEDTGHSSYHMECALRLSGEITADLQTMISEPDVLTHFSQQQAATEAFRRAAHPRDQGR